MDSGTRIRMAQSSATDTREAVREFHTGVAQRDMALVIFFCSSEYDLEVLAEEMRYLFAGVQVVGCTTAGEIGVAGYCDHSLTGASFPASSFNAVSGRIGHLQQFTVSAGQGLVQELLQELESRVPEAEAYNSFALLLIDGLSLREERVTHVLQNSLGKLPLLGGSAGDDEHFFRTQVYFEGHFCSDSAILVLIATRLPIKLFKTHHFLATEERLVITEADPAFRIVKEINGLPAAREYARILGIEVRDLTASHFAAWPLVVSIDGRYYVRSIERANPDGSLTFFCAIENGLVLRMAKGLDLVANLEQTFSQIRSEIGAPQLVLGCDCLLRKLEIFQNSLQQRVGEIFVRNNTIGFNTYGEQFLGVHINQTLVGIAIGTDSVERNNEGPGISNV